MSTVVERLRFDHPQSAVANGGREYRVSLWKNVFTWTWHIASGSILAGTYESTGIGRRLGRQRALSEARDVAKADAYSKGLYKFRPETGFSDLSPGPAAPTEGES